MCSALGGPGADDPDLPGFMRTGINPVPTRAQGHVGTPLVGVRPLGQRPALHTHGQGVASDLWSALSLHRIGNR